MREALTILGFGPCHHIYEVIYNETQQLRWRALVQGEAPDWENLFDGNDPARNSANPLSPERAADVLNAPPPDRQSPMN